MPLECLQLSDCVRVLAAKRCELGKMSCCQQFVHQDQEVPEQMD